MLKRTQLLLRSFGRKNGLSSVHSKAKHTADCQLAKFRFFHSISQEVDHNKMKIQILPALQDNYMYLIIDERTKEAAIVDPVNPDEVLRAVNESDVKLTKVLTTHHHWDHAGGNEKLVCARPDLLVYGGDDRIGALNCKVEHGSVITIGNLKIECLYTPCHTRGHICYYVTQECSEPVVFTGDTLFSAGCGKFFEGNAEQMNTALNEILAKLPDETKVYCGHEYTVNNLKFALHAEPKNHLLKDKLEWACSQREKNLPTIPSTIRDEKLINPFMRVNEPGIKQHTKKNKPIDVMASLREEKDSFQC